MLMVFAKGYVGTQHENTHVATTIFLVIGCIIAASFGMTIYNTYHQRRTEETISPADGFTISSYKVYLKVNENNSIDVVEHIGINFFEDNHHGIFRFIPEWLEYTDKNNNIKSRKAEIIDLKAEGENYTIDTVKGKERIKIGNANITLPIGLHYYTISYTYDMGGDPYEGFDEFIFHAFGDYWGTTINDASIVIAFPKHVAIDGNLHFFADKYREKDITNQVDYHIEDNVLYANLSKEYPLSKSLTVFSNSFIASSNTMLSFTSLFLLVINPP